MIDVRLSINEGQFANAERLLSGIKHGVPKAAMRAINRTIEGVRTEAVRSVRETYVIRAGDVRETMAITRASAERLVARLRSRGGVLRLIKFQVRPMPKPGKHPVGGLHVTVRRGEGGPLTHAFIARMGNGSIGMFSRVGKKRLPIKQHFGPAIPTMLGEAGVSQRIQAKADATLAKRFDHEVDALLRRYTR